MLAYTLVRNKAYKNVSSIFEDEDRRDLENDTITVIKGLEGSYPNFFYIVELDETEPLKEGDEIISIKNRQDYEKFVANFGIRRTSNTFWQTADWFQARAPSAGVAREWVAGNGLSECNSSAHWD